MTTPALEPIARAALAAAALYAALGAAVAVGFAARGVDRLDPAARGAGWAFRLVLLPAATLLWPLLLRRWLAGASAPPRERTAHDREAERP